MLRRKIWDYVGRKCSICGYNKNINVLELHHINPKEKEFTISGNHSRSWEKIKKELDKCMVVCSNCHREIHNPDDSNLR
jgi:predicted HNH restriction endonuclease